MKDRLRQLKDYEALKSRCERAEEAQARLEAVVTAMDDGVIGALPDGTIMDWNPAAERIFDHKKEDILGRSLTFLITPGHADEVPVALAKVAKGERLERYETLGMRKGGRPIRISLDMSPVRDVSGAIIGVSAIVRDVTERRRAEDVLQSANERLSAALESVTDAYFVLDSEWRFREVSHGAGKILGRGAEELVGSVPWQKCPDIFGTELHRQYETAASENRAIRTEAYFAPLDRWFEISVRPGRNCLESYLRDITAHKRAEEEAIKAGEQARARLAEIGTIYAKVPAALCFVDTSLRYLSVNEQFAAMNGLPADEHIGRPVGGALPLLTDRAERYLLHVIETGEAVEDVEIHAATMVRPDVERDWLASFSPVLDDSGGLFGVNVALQEITEHKRAEEALRLQALHDALTGLPNRMLFMEHLNIEIAEARRNRKMMAVMFLDLDNFKNINDTLGHSMGDRLLKQAAVRLKTCIRESDTMARIGGDEFNMVLPDIASPGDAVSIAGKITSLFKDPFMIEEEELHITASIGISIYPDDGKNSEALLKNADIAMYQAKEQGGNRHHFYSSAMNLRTLEKTLLGNNLRRMFEQRELVLHYQPQLNIGTRQVRCAEALVRWQHPDLGLLSPAQFLPLAAETGFITSLDEWVLHAACAQARAWRAAGQSPLCVTVNLSTRQFLRRNLAGMLSRILEETGLEPGLLELEISEGAVMNSMESTLSILRRLADLGIGVSLDNFGSEFSCLSLLGKLPVRKLKIDSSFIRELKADQTSRAVVTSMIKAAHKMKMEVVAEGVETDDQLAFLRSIGCDNIQGYLVSKPLPGDKFEQWVISVSLPGGEGKK